MRNLRNRDGFTLIELMIVVVIIGILAAIAIPKFSQVSKGAKEAEAESILKQIHSLQESQKQKSDTYATTLTTAALPGWDSPNAKYYNFTIVSGSATAYCAQAAPNTAGTNAGLQTFSVRVTNSAAPAANDGKPQAGGCTAAAAA